jgi:ABC-type antimicrobial peptide transport system permease subunit
MGVPILLGRDLTDADTATSTHVSVINESAAKKFFPGINALGRRFNVGDDPDTKTLLWYTVVGICADTQYSGLKRPRESLHFDPIVQSKDVSGGTFLVRTSLPAAEAVPMIRKAIAGIDPDLPMMNVRMLDEQIADSLRQERLIATLTAGFGLLALLLASVGIYGLMAYTVAQRTNEIGIRLALGARRMQVRAIVLREVTVLTLSGVLIGCAGVLAAMHLMHDILYDSGEGSNQGMLFGLHGYDPTSLALTAMVLFLVALLAGWIPAARASRVEPMEALRHE